jgi:urate oxidase
VVKVIRGANGVHNVMQLSVQILLEGDTMGEVYETGDNAKVVATDTCKNTVYVSYPPIHISTYPHILIYSYTHPHPHTHILISSYPHIHIYSYTHILILILISSYPHILISSYPHILISPSSSSSTHLHSYCVAHENEFSSPEEFAVLMVKHFLNTYPELYNRVAVQVSGYEDMWMSMRI